MARPAQRLAKWPGAGEGPVDLGYHLTPYHTIGVDPRAPFTSSKHGPATFVLVHLNDDDYHA